MSARLSSLCVLSLLFGCSQQPTGSPDVPDPSAAATLAPDRGVSAAEEAAQAALLAELTQAVRRYGVEQQRAPKTLEEVAAGGYLNQVPSAPPGKRYAINKNLQVYLADQ